jgi:V8-like Glu-specific endopeptidase
MRVWVVLTSFLLGAAVAVSGATWEEDDMVIIEAAFAEPRTPKQFLDFRQQMPAAVVMNPGPPVAIPAVAPGGSHGVTFVVPAQGGVAAAPEPAPLPPAEYQPCETNDGRTGRCTSVNTCYPFFRLFEFDHSEQWIMGSYDTCKYYGPTRSYVFGVCCPNIGSKPTKIPVGLELIKDDDKEDVEFPVEAQKININCGKRFVRNDVTRIVNGEIARKHEFPFMAALLNKERQFCGGSLIDSSHILTAAHCVAHMSKYDVKNLRVILGDHNLKDDYDANAEKYRVKRVIRHKGFDASTLHNDVAILTLDKEVQLGTGIQPVCLEISAFDYTASTVSVAGWGTTKDGGQTSSTLRKVDVRVWTNKECASSYGNKAPGGIIDTMICASTPELRKDSCSGDSGGPLFTCTGNTCRQIGVVSWGIGCARAEFPGVYTSVTKFQEWIGRIIRKY